MKSIIFKYFIILATIQPVFSQSFQEISNDVGVKHLTISFNLMGGGISFFDFNNDGFEDMIISGGATPDRLFKNNGDGTFLDITEFAGLSNEDVFKTTGVIAGDINNDGFRDLFITTEELDGNILYLNNGDGTFSDISKKAGIANEKVWSTGAVFVDVNLDSYLDIYVINYVDETIPVEDEFGVTIGFDHDCYNDQLFINNGDNTFTELSALFNITNDGCGLAVTSTDYNNDALPDIYVANDFGEWVVPNRLFKNNFPQQEFIDMGVESNLNAAVYGMGIAIGDINRDGLKDYYVTNLGRNVLHLNNGNNTFSDITSEANVESTTYNDLMSTGWGTAFFDYDNDGLEDLFVSNGYIPAALFIETTEEDPNRMYKNIGNNKFKDVTIDEDLFDADISRGMAYSDYDNDGDLDFAVTKLGKIIGAEGNMLFYRNKTNNSNHWLKVKVEGVTNNKDGFGTNILAYKNEYVWIEEINGGSSHTSQNSSIAHFGLAEYETIDSIVAIWPGGKRQMFKNLATNKTYYFKENEDIIYIAGCMDNGAENYDPAATYNYGCFKKIKGCIDPSAYNFDINATISDGSCDYRRRGCMDVKAGNYDPNAEVDDGSCEYVLSTNDSFEGAYSIYADNPNKTINLFISKNYQRGYLKIISVDGKTLSNQNILNNYHKFSINGLRQGIYIYSLILDNLHYTGKLLIK